MRLLLLFLFGVLVELLATTCFHYTQHNEPFTSASINVVLVGLVLFAFVEVNRVPQVAIPYLGGIWLGGYLGMRIKVRLEKKT